MAAPDSEHRGASDQSEPRARDQGQEEKLALILLFGLHDYLRLYWILFYFRTGPILNDEAKGKDSIISLRPIKSNPTVRFIKLSVDRVRSALAYQQRLRRVGVSKLNASHFQLVIVDSAGLRVVLDRGSNILA